jgi:hypothetical protein
VATIWERIQAAAKAAINAWQTNDSVFGPGGLLDDLTPEHRKRAQQYELYWRYYRGQMRRPLKVKPGHRDDNVLINHCRRVVDKGIAFLFGKELVWELVEGEQTEEEKLLDDAWGSIDKRMTILQGVALNGGVCGTYYLQILPGRANTNDSPRILNLYPGIVFPEWDPNDVSKVLAYQVRWRTRTKVHRTIWSLAENGNQWEFWSEVLEGGNRWRKDRDPEIWDFPWCPIVAGQNLINPNEFYGLSDLEDADLNDAVNFVASNINRIIRLYGHPILWGYGFTPQDLKADPGSVILANNGEKALLQYLQMISDLSSSHNFMLRLTTDLYKTARVPEMDPTQVTVGAQSGFALRLLYSDLLEKTETKRRLYGQVIVEVNRRLLDMLGRGDDHIVTLYWKDPLPLNEQERNATDGFELQEGLASKETISKRRGLDYDAEQERIRKAQAEATNLGQLLLQRRAAGNMGNASILGELGSKAA